MSAILAGVLGVIAREIIQYVSGLIAKWRSKYQATKASDQKIDDHAKEVSEEMENTHDPTKMDQADSDLLSGN